MQYFKEEGISHDLRELANSKRLLCIDNIEANLRALENKMTSNQFNVQWAKDEDSLLELLKEWLPNPSYNRVCVDAESVPENFYNQGNLLKVCKLDDVINHADDVNTLIIEADFAIVESGELVFLNRKFTGCLNQVKNLIVLVNFDQILEKQEDIALFSHIKSFYKEDNFSIFFLQSPYDIIEAEDFQLSSSAGFNTEKAKVNVVLYVNNIIPLLSNIHFRDALYCVKCGRCSQVCPLSTAEHSVSPIDLIKTNLLECQQGARNLFKQTSLCGNCQQCCPVNIPLTDMMLYEMQISNNFDNFSKNKHLFSFFSKRSKMNKLNSRFVKWWFVKHFFGKNSTLKSYFNQQNSEIYNVLVKDSEEENVQ